MLAKTAKTKKQSGMSLIEVIVCMFFLASMFALYAAALNTVALSKKFRYENYAYHIANKKMEELRATPFASLPASGPIADSMLSNIPSGNGSFTTANYVSFTGIKEITVTVTWNDGIAKQIQIKSLAGTGGINE